MNSLNNTQAQDVSGGNPVAIVLAVITVADWAIDLVRGFQDGAK